VGIILAWFWKKTKNIFGKDINGAVNFGFAYWILSSVPGMFISYSSFQLSLLIIISWLVSGLASAILAGIIFSKILQD